MRTWTIAFLMGIVAAQQCSQTPSSVWLLLLPVSLLISIIARSWLKPVFAFSTGFLWVFAYVLLFSHHTFPQDHEGKELLLEGTIASIPKSSSRSLRFDFNTQLTNKPYRFRLSWYEKQDQQPKAGEHWRLLVKLKRPYGTSNPGGFDYERNLYRHGISATGYVRRDAINERMENLSKLTTIDMGVNQLRQYISDTLRERLMNSSHQGLIEALAIGNRDRVTSSEWDILTRTGTIHLVAISGLHIGLVAGLVFFLVRFVVSHSKILFRYFPAQVPAAGCAIIAAFIYALLAGFSIPTQRAFLMVCVIMASLIYRRTILPSNVLAVSMLIILCLDPMSVLDMGFWLSFAAVAIIIFSVAGRIRSAGLLMGWGKIQFVIAAGMLPISLLFFQKISIAAPFANLIAVPVVSFITVPMTLLGTMTLDILPVLSDRLLYLATTSLDMLWVFLEWLNSQSWSIIETTAPVTWTLLPATIGAVWMLMPRGSPVRWLSIILFLPALLITQERPKPNELRLSLIDVGQGLSVFIETRNHNLVYDTGPRYSSRFDSGKNIIIPFLKSQGVTKLDTLIVSHGDNDHSGGAKAIIQLLKVKTIYTGANPRRWQHMEAKRCQSGESWQWDGVDFKFIHPVDGDTVGGNNSSCVLKVSIGSHAILLPGDIEARAEHELVARLKDNLQSDLLISPHHGSKTSSSSAFVDQVAPELILIGNGYRNRYRFPHHGVTRRYEEAGIAWYETARQGAISVNMNGEGLGKPVFWRNRMQRYWHTQ